VEGIGDLKVCTLSFVLRALKFQLIDFEGQSPKHEEQRLKLVKKLKGHQLTSN